MIVDRKGMKIFLYVSFRNQFGLKFLKSHPVLIPIEIFFEYPRENVIGRYMVK